MAPFLSLRPALETPQIALSALPLSVALGARHSWFAPLRAATMIFRYFRYFRRTFFARAADGPLGGETDFPLFPLVRYPTRVRDAVLDPSHLNVLPDGFPSVYDRFRPLFWLGQTPHLSTNLAH